MQTIEEWYRAHHDDLQDMDRSELYRELRRVRYRLDLETPSNPWLLERENEIIRALGRLNRDTNRKRDERPKPKPIDSQPTRRRGFTLQAKPVRRES